MGWGACGRPAVARKKNRVGRFFCTGKSKTSKYGVKQSEISSDAVPLNLKGFIGLKNTICRNINGLKSGGGGDAGGGGDKKGEGSHR